MVKKYYNSVQTLNEWVDTIENKFNDISLLNTNDIIKIVGIDSDNELAKIKQAHLIVFAKKYGVLNFENACVKLGLKFNTNNFDKSTLAFNKLKIIAQVINEGWYPNWKDNQQWKYFPYFDMERGFSYHGTNCRNTFMTVPSALYLKTRELAYFMGNYYNDLYKDFME